MSEIKRPAENETTKKLKYEFGKDNPENNGHGSTTSINCGLYQVAR